ncbi:hypothetical protein [Streptomyces sp. NBC_00102]|uniref:hypothetical protein n=1 Tax=Streptomyces sp. NBC_00102 TaxID=2975652 RepID=UPI00225A435D|nr:hypothetical protein [Streptomyces sp. NBC_00102]MCX5398379.1 hypothetical protein [Streptomyces sp. NBC_00102]
MPHRPRRTAALFTGVLLVGGLTACDPEGLHSAEHAGPFPYESPADTADVDLREALSDYGVRLPEGAEKITYGALKALDGYPFRVEFSMPCDGVPAFVRDSRLVSVGTKTPDAVEMSVLEAGFPLDEDPAYARAKESELLTVYAAVIERSGTCKVFLSS